MQIAVMAPVEKVRRGYPMTIHFTCPTCKKNLKAPDEKAGAKVKCPGCKTVLPIPLVPAKGDTKQVVTAHLMQDGDAEATNAVRPDTAKTAVTDGKLLTIDDVRRDYHLPFHIELEEDLAQGRFTVNQLLVYRLCIFTFCNSLAV